MKSFSLIFQILNLLLKSRFIRINSTWILTHEVIIIILLLLKSFVLRDDFSKEVCNSWNNFNQVPIDNSKIFKMLESWQHLWILSLQENSNDANTGIHNIGHSILIISQLTDFFKNIIVFWFDDSYLILISLLLIREHVNLILSVSFVMIKLLFKL